jgi:hypothetical protein
VDGINSRKVMRLMSDKNLSSDLLGVSGGGYGYGCGAPILLHVEHGGGPSS